MKFVFALIAFVCLTLSVPPAFAGFQAQNGTTNLRTFDGIRCSAGLACSRSKNFMVIQSTAGLRTRTVIGTNTVLTAAACNSTVVNSAAAQATLPAATNLGCRITFIVDNASTFTVRAAGADQILQLTTGAGRAITNGARGNVVMLEASGVNAWSPVTAPQGTWSDTP